jgi:Asp-tRNA(Asn)/Glu-tRNA(Gln) amidotransferase A subunit family amidase
VSDAVAAFESLGATVDAVDLNIPYAQAELSTMWCRLTAIGVYESMRRLARDGIDLRTACPDELPPSMMYWVDRVPRLTIDDLLRDQTVRTTVLDRFNAVFDEFDFIVAPTVTRLPVLKADNGDTLGPSMINGESIDPS